MRLPALSSVPLVHTLTCPCARHWPQVAPGGQTSSCHQGSHEKLINLYADTNIRWQPDWLLVALGALLKGTWRYLLFVVSCSDTQNPNVWAEKDGLCNIGWTPLQQRTSPPFIYFYPLCWATSLCTPSLSLHATPPSIYSFLITLLLLSPSPSESSPLPPLSHISSPPVFLSSLCLSSIFLQSPRTAAHKRTRAAGKGRKPSLPFVVRSGALVLFSSVVFSSYWPAAAQCRQDAARVCVL